MTASSLLDQRRPEWRRARRPGVSCACGINSRAIWGAPIEINDNLTHCLQLVIFCLDADGSRVNVEVASVHSSASAIRAKAHAGFVVHATRSAQARVIPVLGTGDDHASTRGLAQRDPAAFEL